MPQTSCVATTAHSRRRRLKQCGIARLARGRAHFAHRLARTGVRVTARGLLLVVGLGKRFGQLNQIYAARFRLQVLRGAMIVGDTHRGGASLHHRDAGASLHSLAASREIVICLGLGSAGCGAADLCSCSAARKVNA